MNDPIEFLSGLIPPMSAFDSITLYYVLLALLGASFVLVGRRKWAERIETETLRAQREERKKIF